MQVVLVMGHVFGIWANAWVVCEGLSGGKCLGKSQLLCCIFFGWGQYLG